MPDWKNFVQARLSQKRGGAPLEDEVVQELADYFEDAAEARTPTAISQKQGIDAIAAEVRNWPRLARQINAARGGTMVKQRTLTMWLPGVASTTAAFLLLCASQKIGARPRFVEVSPRMAAMIYIGWLFLLPAFGAFAAWWSRRAGGSIPNRLMAALFPIFSMIAIYLVIFSSAMLTNHGLDVPNLFRSLISALVLGIFVPASALAVGALPYLKTKLPCADAR
jgi:hypothetical protein